jgi:hypothetical protein
MTDSFGLLGFSAFNGNSEREIRGREQLFAAAASHLKLQGEQKQKFLEAVRNYQDKYPCAANYLFGEQYRPDFSER